MKYTRSLSSSDAIRLNMGEGLHTLATPTWTRRALDLGMYCIQAATYVAILVLQAYAIALIYNWYFVPLGLPVLSFYPILGVLLIASIVRSILTPDLNLYKFIRTVLLLGAAYLVHTQYLQASF